MKVLGITTIDPQGSLCLSALCDTQCCSAGERQWLNNTLSKPLLPGKLQHSAHLSWQDMASTAKEDTGQSSRSWSQPPQAAPPEAEEDSQCPICLDCTREPAYVTYCMHKFCFKCIQLWTRTSDNCPVCRQPIHWMLYSVRGDRDYRQRPISLAARLYEMQRMAGVRDSPPGTAAMLSMTQALQDQQHLYGRRNSLQAERAQRQEAAPGLSNAHSHQVPAALHEMTPLRESEGLASPAAPLEPQNGTE